MLATTLFFIVAYFWGRAIIKLVKLDLTIQVKNISSIIFGVVTACLILFGLGHFFPFTNITIYLTLAVMLIVSLRALRKEIFPLDIQNLEIIYAI